MNRTIRIFWVAVFCSICLTTSAAYAQTRRPNILVIVADDMGYADIGVHGSKDILTPHIDSLARSGVRFSDAYVSGPYCSPTRTGLLTGRYPQRFGHEFNILNHRTEHSDVGMPLTEITMADRFRAAGYSTALFGKWHLGEPARFHPMERGFDEFFGFMRGQHTYLSPEATATNPLYDGRKLVTEPAYLTDVLASRASDFIRRKRERPFFLYLAFNAVHTPMQVTEKYLARYAHIQDERRRTYAAMLSAMDDGIGRTLAALRAENLEEDTLIFFFSDNGGPTLFGDPNGSKNDPLRGSKRTTWEGGIRVPFIVQWKGRVQGGRVYSKPVIQLDVLPTAMAAAGIKLSGTDKLDGVDLLPFISGRSTRNPHEILFWRLGRLLAVRKGDWKLVKMSENGYREEPVPLTGYDGLELYDLRRDIGETTDLARKNPKKVTELARDWSKWTDNLAKPAWPALGPLPERRGTQ